MARAPKNPGLADAQPGGVAEASRSRGLWLALLLSAVLTCAGAGTGPEDTLREYYQAVDSGDCERAVALRPRYPMSTCRAIESAALQSLQLLKQMRKHAAFLMSVDIGPAEATRADGWLVGLKDCGDRWIILNDSVTAESEMAHEAFADAVIAGDWDGPVDLCARSGADDVASGSTVEPEPHPAGAGGPSGSAHLLHACWSEAELAPRTGEELVAAVGRHRDALPPTWAAPLPTASASAAAAGVVRRVQPGDAKLLALTFNLIERSGEVAGFDGELVDLLRQKQIPATFFASGRWLLSHPERARQLLADPNFEVGSLGWEHRNAAVIPADEAGAQWRLAEQTYRRLRWDLSQRGCTADAAGHRNMARIPDRPVALRFPYGRCDTGALGIASQQGLPIVQWSMPLDDIAADAAVDASMARVRTHLRDNGPGAILVGHGDGRGRITVELVRQLLAEPMLADYRFVRVSDLLRLGTPVYADECYEYRPGDNLSYDQSFVD
jgi:peptidoglycan-N-acetylglucosamine deacetylase